MRKDASLKYLDLKRELFLCDTSLSMIAKERGFNLKTVSQVIRRYWDAGKAPRGPKSREILQAVGEALQKSPTQEREEGP